MNIIINGKKAPIKKGSSFELISENRLFTEADSYTLPITFQLGCKENQEIFGHINRSDFEHDNYPVLSCSIEDRNWHEKGILVITDVTDYEVKTQFLAGKSEMNYSQELDEIYIDEIDYGPENVESVKTMSAIDAMDGYERGYIAITWGNNTSGNVQNEMGMVGGTLKWITTDGLLSLTPYMTFLVKKMFESIGYAYDLSEWEESSYKYLLCCNTIPAAWYQSDRNPNAASNEYWKFKYALPHWTVKEFLYELQKLMNADFTIDKIRKKITFKFVRSLVESAGFVSINNVTNEFSYNVDEGNETNYKKASNLAYSDAGYYLWPIYSCRWFTENLIGQAESYSTLQELLDKKSTLKIPAVDPTTHASSQRSSKISQKTIVYYASDVDTYFARYSVRKEPKVGSEDRFSTVFKLIPINQFGERFVRDKAQSIDMNIVPVMLDDWANYNQTIMFLDVGTLNSNNDVVYGNVFSEEVVQTEAIQIIKAGEKERQEIFNKIYAGFFDNNTAYPSSNVPFPNRDKVEIINDGWDAMTFNSSLRINGRLGLTPYEANNNMLEIDPTRKYEFSWIGDEIPNPLAVFYIRSKKFICEQIKASFSENGMSKVLKGTFYRVLE